MPGSSPLRHAFACAALLAAGLAGTGCGTSAGTREPPPPGDTPETRAAAAPSVFDTLDRPQPTARPEKVPAVTHLGREVLPHVGLVVLGRSASLSTVAGGVEVARFRVDEVLRSVPWDRVPDDPEDPVLTVFCGEPGMLPRPGEPAVLLVARRARSPNHDVVQVVGVDGKQGSERLEALREYLAVEEIADEEERVAALLGYLRRAVRDGRRWTRANAAREYGSLARARPGDLGPGDAAVLRAAVVGAGEADVRSALQSALDVAERNARGPATVSLPGTGPGGDDPADALQALDEEVARYLETQDPLERRQVVVDAALRLGRDATPLLRRALSDDDPRVREAAVAAAGQLGLRGVGPDLVPLLSGDEPVPVVRSAVRALGFLRERKAVPTLAALARNTGDVGDDACYALARIRDTESVTALGRLLAGARAERMELLEFLLSDAFVEQEAALGRRLD